MTNFTKPEYSLRSVHAAKVLDICQDGPLKGQAIIWESYAGSNQIFIPEVAGQEFYLRCKVNNQYLTVENQKDGAKLILTPKSGGANQRFRRVDKGKKNFQIITCHGKCLDVCEEKKDNGTKVIQYTPSDHKNQLWNFVIPKKGDESSSSDHHN